jgi:hypothetical protein
VKNRSEAWKDHQGALLCCFSTLRSRIAGLLPWFARLLNHCDMLI